MPGFDTTGPHGKGPASGGGRGNCRRAERPDDTQNPGGGAGGGRCRAQGGGGQGKGKGRGRRQAGGGGQDASGNDKQGR